METVDAIAKQPYVNAGNNRSAAAVISKLTVILSVPPDSRRTLASVISKLTGAVSVHPDTIGVLSHIMGIRSHNLISIPISLGGGSITSATFLTEVAKVLTTMATRQQARS